MEHSPSAGISKEQQLRFCCNKTEATASNTFETSKMMRTSLQDASIGGLSPCLLHTLHNSHARRKGSSCLSRSQQARKRKCTHTHTNTLSLTHTQTDSDTQRHPYIHQIADELETPGAQEETKPNRHFRVEALYSGIGVRHARGKCRNNRNRSLTNTSCTSSSAASGSSILQSGQ